VLIPGFDQVFIGSFNLKNLAGYFQKILGFFGLFQNNLGFGKPWLNLRKINSIIVRLNVLIFIIQSKFSKDDVYSKVFSQELVGVRLFAAHLSRAGRITFDEVRGAADICMANRTSHLF